MMVWVVPKITAIVLISSNRELPLITQNGIGQYQ